MTECSGRQPGHFGLQQVLPPATVLPLPGPLSRFRRLLRAWQQLCGQRSVLVGSGAGRTKNPPSAPLTSLLRAASRFLPDASFGVVVTEAEIPLTGGTLNTVVRVGDTVRRPAGPWTPTVQALLRHVRDRGFDLAPEPLGFDDLGPGDGRLHPRHHGGLVASVAGGDPRATNCWPRWGEATARYHRAVARFPTGRDWSRGSRSRPRSSRRNWSATTISRPTTSSWPVDVSSGSSTGIWPGPGAPCPTWPSWPGSGFPSMVRS